MAVDKEQAKTTNKIFDNAVKGLAVVGAAALLAFLIWVCMSIPSVASSVFPKITTGAIAIKSQLFPAESISFNVTPSEIKSGNTFTASYSYNQNTPNNNLLFSYKCGTDTTLKINFSKQGQFSTLTCGSPIYLNPERSKLYIKAVNEDEKPANLHFTLKTAEGNLQEEENIQVLASEKEKTVKEDGAEDSEAASQDTQEVSTVRETELEAGEKQNARYQVIESGERGGISRPDLVGEVLAIGQGEVGSDNKGCEFISTSTELKKDNRAAIRFSVKNTGNTETGKWSFDIIPTFTRWEENYIDNQISINPNDRIEYTTCFKTQLNKEKIFKVNIDPEDKIKEIDEDNNLIEKEVIYTSKD